MFILRKLDNQIFVLSEQRIYSIGRVNCDIIITADYSVSKKHALLEIKKDNSIWLKDLGSKYYTYYNKIRVKPFEEVRCHVGGVLQLGLFLSVFKLEEKIENMAETYIKMEIDDSYNALDQASSINQHTFNSTNLMESRTPDSVIYGTQQNIFNTKSVIINENIKNATSSCAIENLDNVKDNLQNESSQTMTFPKSTSSQDNLEISPVREVFGADNDAVTSKIHPIITKTNEKKVITSKSNWQKMLKNIANQLSNSNISLNSKSNAYETETVSNTSTCNIKFMNYRNKIDSISEGSALYKSFRESDRMPIVNINSRRNTKTIILNKKSYKTAQEKLKRPLLLLKDNTSAKKIKILSVDTISAANSKHNNDISVANVCEKIANEILSNKNIEMPNATKEKFISVNLDNITEIWSQHELNKCFLTSIAEKSLMLSNVNFNKIKESDVSANNQILSITSISQSNSTVESNTFVKTHPITNIESNHSSDVVMSIKCKDTTNPFAEKNSLDKNPHILIKQNNPSKLDFTTVKNEDLESISISNLTQNKEDITNNRNNFEDASKPTHSKQDSIVNKDVQGVIMSMLNPKFKNNFSGPNMTVDENIQLNESISNKSISANLCSKKISAVKVNKRVNYNYKKSNSSGSRKSENTFPILENSTIDNCENISIELSEIGTISDTRVVRNILHLITNSNKSETSNNKTSTFENLELDAAAPKRTDIVSRPETTQSDTSLNVFKFGIVLSNSDNSYQLNSQKDCSFMKMRTSFDALNHLFYKNYSKNRSNEKMNVEHTESTNPLQSQKNQNIDKLNRMAQIKDTNSTVENTQDSSNIIATPINSDLCINNCDILPKTDYSNMETEKIKQTNLITIETLNKQSNVDLIDKSNYSKHFENIYELTKEKASKNPVNILSDVSVSKSNKSEIDSTENESDDSEIITVHKRKKGVAQVEVSTNANKTNDLKMNYVGGILSNKIERKLDHTYCYINDPDANEIDDSLSTQMKLAQTEFTDIADGVNKSSAESSQIKNIQKTKHDSGPADKNVSFSIAEDDTFLVKNSNDNHIPIAIENKFENDLNLCKKGTSFHVQRTKIQNEYVVDLNINEKTNDLEFSNLTDLHDNNSTNEYHQKELMPSLLSSPISLNLYDKEEPLKNSSVSNIKNVNPLVVDTVSNNVTNDLASACYPNSSNYNYTNQKSYENAYINKDLPPMNTIKHFEKNLKNVTNKIVDHTTFMKDFNPDTEKNIEENCHSSLIQINKNGTNKFQLFIRKVKVADIVNKFQSEMKVDNLTPDKQARNGGKQFKKNKFASCSKEKIFEYKEIKVSINGSKTFS